MSTTKKIMLVTYVILAILAFTQGNAALGIWSGRLLLILAAAHAVEMLVFFKACRTAGGSMPAHMLNVFLFGIVHMNELKAAGKTS